MINHRYAPRQRTSREERISYRNGRTATIEDANQWELVLDKDVPQIDVNQI